MSETISYTPTVNEVQEFKEIAEDFSNALDLVREAISNAFDAEATRISLDFKAPRQAYGRVLIITIEDNGIGMDYDGLKSFFDLGNSLNRYKENSIGEKGHGTKVYYHSEKIEVITSKNGTTLHATMNEPWKKLFEGEIPSVTIETHKVDNNEHGTRIIITGYNENERSMLTHENIKDYIIWFTKYGSVEQEFGINTHSKMLLSLKGVDRDEPETIAFGHVFPTEDHDINRLFDRYELDAPNWYCKKIIKTGALKNYPETKYQAVFYIEGNKVRYNYNPMVRRSGYHAPEGAYTIQERYGLYLCKDYIPIQKKNEWITYKGSEFTRFHAFVNCQDLCLTANRGSVDNTSLKILDDLKIEVENIFSEIITSDDWDNMGSLNEMVVAEKTARKERKTFTKRIDKINRTKTADYKGIHLVEPRQENGVFALLVQLSNRFPDMFPFTIIDYDTHDGYDVIVKAKNRIPIKNDTLYYVEFKKNLGSSFDHTFKNLHSIVCWDINLRDIRNDQEVRDLDNRPRKLKIIPPEQGNTNGYTKYFLDDPYSSNKIEVFVLKYYLAERFGIEFKPRSEDAFF